MKKLIFHLKNSKLNYLKLAKELNVTPRTVHNWLADRTVPNVLQAIKIEKITNGKVSVHDWGK